jgi:hypothetical protein
LFLLATSGPVLAGDSADSATKKFRIFTAQGWSLGISFSAGALERVLTDNPDRIKIEKIDFEILYYANGHYLLHIPAGLKKDRLPGPNAAVAQMEPTEVIESPRSILLVQSKTDYPFVENILQRANDRSDAVTYELGVRRQSASFEEISAASGARLKALRIGASPLGATWIETVASHYKLTVDGNPVEITLIGKPAGGFSRVKPALERRLREITEPALFINLGGTAIQDEFGVTQGVLLKSMLDSGLRLIAFSGIDMEYGWDWLLKYSQTGPPEKRAILLASNLKPNNPTAAAAIHRTHIETIDGVKVGLFSLLDLSVNASISRRKVPWTATDPIAVARDIVEELRTKDKVDLVVCISHMPVGFDAKLIQEIGGIDLFLGTALRERASRRRTIVDLTGWAQEEHNQPALIATPPSFTYDEIALEMSRRVDGYELTRIEELPGPLGPNLPIDKDMSDLEGRLFNYFEEGKDPILPDARALWPQAAKPKLSFQPPEFWNIAAQAVRRQTGAEIALLRIRPMGNNVSGEQTENFVANWLDTKERLVRLKLTGADLRLLLPRIIYGTFPLPNANDAKYGYEIWLAQAGLTSNGMTHNLPLRDGEMYSVATTEDLLKQSDELPALTAASDVQIQDLTLDQAVISWLKRRRRQADASAAADARTSYVSDIRSMAEGITPERPVWRLDLRELSGQFSNTQLHNQAPFSQVPDARIQGVSQVQGQGTLRLFSEVYWRKWRWDVGTTAQYGKVIIKPPGAPEVVNKTQDQLLTETEVRHRTFRFDRGRAHFSLGPYLNASYDTQFTPTPSAIVPFRRYFWLKPGFKLFEGKSLRELRVAAVTQTDYSRAQTKTVYGFETGYDWLSSIPRSNATFESKASYIQFAPNHLDTLGDLRRQLEVTAKLHVPVFGKLQLSPFISYYLFDSKLLPARGYNLLFGFSIDCSYLWKPVY